MTFYYFDASAWAKNYFEESGSDWVSERFAEECEMACSLIGLPEITATLCRKQRERVISNEESAEKLKQIEYDWTNFTKGIVDAFTADLAKQTALRHVLKGADAIHLATAIHMSSQIPKGYKFVLVTADNQMFKAGVKEGITVVNPNEI